jgi:23S rRNA (pseudouridine1915-N3)-methyltransferase
VKVVIAVVGKPRDRHLAAAIDDYETRIRRYFTLELVEVKEASSKGGAPEQVKVKEGERLLDRIPVGAALFVCDERGDSMTSQQFAELIRQARDSARDVAFVIGGAFGLSDDVRGRAARVLQLAPFTVPHEMARLILAEQVYRAGTILRGEPYHK